MTTTVRVFHNNNPRDAMVFGFQPAPYQVGDTEQPAHTVTEVFSYTALPDDPYPVQFAYDLCNIGDDPTFFDRPDPRAVEYRDRANRSLSVGDVVAVHDNRGERGTRWYACAHAGFDLLDQGPVIENAEQHGTTPIDAPLVGYVVTFASPRELERERWVIEAYAHNQLTRRIQQRLMTQLKVERVRLRFTSIHTGFALSAAGAEVAEFTAVPVPGTAEFPRYKAGTEPLS
ncbi:hypothetical protein [Actinophytocola glycyrrhizae]|uniref:Uncharacterized protein n=1 Tax=Actinophytocola glycyrrhizae TaxID=2044873 RepID=A0ABV9SH52_9PSEU